MRLDSVSAARNARLESRAADRRRAARDADRRLAQPDPPQRAARPLHERRHHLSRPAPRRLPRRHRREHLRYPSRRRRRGAPSGLPCAQAGGLRLEHDIPALSRARRGAGAADARAGRTRRAAARGSRGGRCRPGGRGDRVRGRIWSAPQVGAIGPARAILAIEPDPAALERAFTFAGELVLVLAAIAPPRAPDGWQLIREEPGPHPVLLRLARLASRPRWRARLLYSTVEHRANWIAVFRAGAFGDGTPLRVYAYRAEHPRAVERSAQLRQQRSDGLPRLRRRRVGELATKLRRLLRAEWAILRARGR